MTLPALTPENVRNIRVWYGALKSATCHPTPNRLTDGNGGYCAVGLGMHALNVFFKLSQHSLMVINDPWEEFSKLIGFPRSKGWDCMPPRLTQELVMPMVDGFNAGSYSFSDCAALMRDYFLENYCIDLADPDAVPAPAQERQAAV